VDRVNAELVGSVERLDLKRAVAEQAVVLQDRLLAGVCRGRSGEGHQQ
jgi:hypothetical protein